MLALGIPDAIEKKGGERRKSKKLSIIECYLLIMIISQGISPQVMNGVGVSMETGGVWGVVFSIQVTTYT